MVKIKINDKELQATEGMTVFQAAQEADIPIPHFCYHPAFIPEGTCRMCLVEIEGMPKLELACSTQVREGMKISTHSDRVKEARRGVLEFLLAEHPLDCPICDQAGECKLQDYYEEYGLYENRFVETKDKHEKKVSLGKTLIHDQERCVLCRRCVRFLREITKTGEMGVFERGGHTEVNIYLGRTIDHNYSGNLAQICPVGAITDRDFRFKTRSWFLEEGESVCQLCSRGCGISVNSHRGFSRFELPQRVYRIRARHNPHVNGDWICDIGRYGYAYLDADRCRAIKPPSGQEFGWGESVAWLKDKIRRLKDHDQTERIGVILNSGLTNEELFLAKKIFRDDLGAGQVFFSDPPSGEGDDLLLTAERSPNRRGAEEIGWDIKPVDLEALSRNTGLLIIFGPYFVSSHDRSGISSCLEAIETKVLLTPRSGALDEMMDMVLPTVYWAEKAGSSTNIDGIVQSFQPALPPPGEGRAEWHLLSDLGRELDINYRYYQSFSSPENIFRAMTGEIPFFEKNGE